MKPIIQIIRMLLKLVLQNKVAKKVEKHNAAVQKAKDNPRDVTNELGGVREPFDPGSMPGE